MAADSIVQGEFPLKRGWKFFTMKDLSFRRYFSIGRASITKANLIRLSMASCKFRIWYSRCLRISRKIPYYYLKSWWTRRTCSSYFASLESR